MDSLQIAIHARKMFDQAGPRAIAIAAQKSRECKAAGDVKQAEDWRSIQLCLMERRGPRAT